MRIRTFPPAALNVKDTAVLLRFLIVTCSILGLTNCVNAETPRMSLATFNVDVTPPLGSPLCDGLVPPADRIDDPLSARGIVLLGCGEPIVLCAVDWVGIGNSGHDAWRAALAEAAGATADRVAVHALHQHDAPGCDFAAEELLAAHGLAGQQFHVTFAREAIQRVADAIRAAIPKARTVTHLGLGAGQVEQVASNRRILGPDGKVQFVRFSASRDPQLQAAPEGTIDPEVQLVSFWDGEQPLTVLSYYATHPQSYYGRGGVSAEFVGLARSAREAALPGVPHIHFNGAGGNVAAGKYNDGSPEKRPLLTARLAAGMQAAWEATTKAPLTADAVEWRVAPVRLSPAERLVEADLLRRIDNPDAAMRDRIAAARGLIWLNRATQGPPIELSCLRLGRAYLLHMPGELFVEYQLAARALRPNDFVAMAAYGDYGPGYIGTKIAYSQGGYETSAVSRVSPEAEETLMQAIRELLR